MSVCDCVNCCALKVLSVCVCVCLLLSVFLCKRSNEPCMRCFCSFCVWACVCVWVCVYLCLEGEVFGEPLLLQPFCPPLLQVWAPKNTCEKNTYIIFLRKNKCTYKVPCIRNVTLWTFVTLQPQTSMFLNGFYVISPHNVMHNCKVEGKTFMVFKIFTHKMGKVCCSSVVSILYAFIPK